MILKNTNLIVKDFIPLYNLRLITQASMIDKQKSAIGKYLSGNETTNFAVINRYNERNSETFNNVIDINLFISKLNHIKTSYTNFMRNIDTPKAINPIRSMGGQSSYSDFIGNTAPYSFIKSIRSLPHRILWSCVARSTDSLWTESTIKNDKKCLSLDILNTRVLTQALLGFYHYRSLWVEGISNDLNGSCRKTAHDITILNTGGSNGYIN
jgi:hypothetical protein